jgi:hypothetical protein
MKMQRHCSRLPNAILPSGRVWSTFPASFLTYCLLCLEIQPSDNLCIPFYCDNFSLPKSEEAFHTGDIDSSSWCTNPDHDVIMTLSALRTKLPLRFASLHVAPIKTKVVNSRPEQLICPCRPTRYRGTQGSPSS